MTSCVTMQYKLSTASIFNSCRFDSWAVRMDTEHLIDFRSQGVTRCTVEVVRPNSYRNELTTSQSVSMTKRKKDRTSRHNPRLFAVVNNSAYKDIISPAQFGGLTGSSSMLSLMLSPIASLVARPLANLVTSPLISFIVNPIARFIVNPITGFIASPFAILSSTIASPIVSKELNERQLIQIGTVDHKPTGIPQELNEKQLIKIGTMESWYYKPTEVNERKPIQTGTSESLDYDSTFTSTFSSSSHLPMTVTTIARNSYSSYLMITK